jgi:hypothetical protein
MDVAASLKWAATNLASAANVLEKAPVSNGSRLLDPDAGYAVWIGLRDGALGLENAISWSAVTGDASIAAGFSRESASLSHLFGRYEGAMNAQVGVNTLVDQQTVGAVKLHAEILAARTAAIA